MKNIETVNNKTPVVMDDPFCNVLGGAMKSRAGEFLMRCVGISGMM